MREKITLEFREKCQKLGEWNSRVERANGIRIYTYETRLSGLKDFLYLGRMEFASTQTKPA